MIKSRRFYILLFISLMTVFPLTACSNHASPDSSFPSSETAGTFEPVHASGGSSGKASILVAQYKDSPPSDAIVERLNQKIADLNIEFVLVQDTGFGNKGSFEQQIISELASGKTSANAYLVDNMRAKYLMQQNITAMDVLPLLQKVAPVYYARYKKALDNQRYIGLPVGMNSTSYRIQPAVMLREDAEKEVSRGIDNLPDFLSFIAGTVDAPGRNWSVMADPAMLMELWLCEQGCYSVGGGLCARIEDTECVPALIEKLPGFYDFIEKMLALYASKLLVLPGYVDDMRETVGVVRDLGKYALPEDEDRYMYVDGTFTAHLFYPGIPSQYKAESYFNGVIVLPQGSVRADDVIKFVDWMYSSQDHYNAVIYGEVGVDFTESSGRVTLLSNGKPVHIKLGENKNNIFMKWPGVQMFSNTDYHLLQQNAPVNYEQLAGKGRGIQASLPFDELQAKADAKSLELLTPTDEAAMIQEKRNNCIYNMLYSSLENGGNYKPYRTVLEALRNEWYLEECQNRISKFKESLHKKE